MATIFPSSPTIGDTFSGYEWDGVSWNIIGINLTADYVTQSELDSYASDSTDIHGIVDTSVLATESYVDNAVASFDALPSQTGHAGEFLTTNGTATSWGEVDVSGAITAHNNQTTSVHGIPDTSQLATLEDVKTVPVSTKTGSYTLALSDAGAFIEINNSSATTITVPLESSVNFLIGTVIIVTRSGTGAMSVVGNSGVQINATPGVNLRAQWSSATLIKRSSDSWILTGDLIA
jgi:hypothetical protein